MAISKIKTNSIANDAITSDKLATGGIATVDMADGSVTSLKILDGGIATVDIANNAITTAKLDTAGISATFAAGTAALPSITTAGDTNTGMFFPAADTIAFTEGGAEAMRIDSSGNLLVGTTTAAVETGSIATAKNLEITRTIDSDGGALGQLSWVNNTNAGIASGTSFAKDVACIKGLMDGTGNNSGGYLTFETKTDTGTRAERMRIDSSGNVGIGTSSPDIYAQSGKMFTVSNTASNSYAYTTLAGSGTGGGEIDLGNQTIRHAAIASLSGSALAFYTNGTNSGAAVSERMRIDSSGNVGIGTSSPGAKLQVAGSVSVTGTNTINASSCIMTIGDNTRTASSSTTTGAIVCGGGLGVWSNVTAGGQGNFSDSVSVFTTNPTSSQQGVLLRNVYNVGPSLFSMGAATSNGIIAFIGGAGTQGAINGNGSGINYVTTSDYRLKENVAPMTGALAKVAQLKPCTYTWKFDGSDGQGFIAHELQEVFPDAVSGEKDDVETYTDEDGNEQTRIKPQGVDTSNLVATLTAAIQEQQALITSLIARIATLEAK